MAVHQLTRAEARQIAITAQLLDHARPPDLTAVIQRLTLLQYDQTAAVAPNADLILWSRLGPAYAPEDLAAALAGQSLIELNMMIRPAEDIALFRADMADWPGRGEVSEWEAALEDWVAANDECRRHILARLYDENPLTARAFPDLTIVPWRSSGWNNDRNVIRLLDQMAARGEVAVVGRRGRDRLWDLAERVYPDDPPVPPDEANRIRDERRLHALGIARARATAVPGEPNHVGEAGEPATIEGVRGKWRVDPAYLGRDFEGRTALLSPLDRLVYDRKRMTEIFEYDYQLEMYKPAAKRRWGYWALPILLSDQLVGKVDATTDRAAGVLRVDAIHEDVPFDRAAVHAELDDLAGWLGLDLLIK
ncbi:crosslink repair DNA glycosylase YcaQ family protein [Actinoplanes sp. NPDC051470]|uniref:DNA glycosylase AlkZ-like family protein n=1 Tax=Actinoplanes sp. NPDC051470 TaxID=3157224 RepID=UPI0034350DC4